jgi:aminoglycoside phosphotransferase family enzyme
MNARQINALASQGTTSGRAIDGRVEETHISWVILTGRFAFKIKKPVKLSFLDFSTLGLRRKFCRKEVALNRRFSSIYLGVEPVRYSARAWSIGKGTGRICDYAVKMRKLDPSRRMDLIAAQGKLRRGDVLALAKKIARFHKTARIIQSGVDLNFVRSAFNDIREIEPFISTEFGKRYSAIIRKVISWSDGFLEKHGARMINRGAEGFKRDVHGDLHMSNIFLYRRPIIFDCIEFNDAYRQMDILDEVAFLCMDLEAHGYFTESRALIRTYTRVFPCVETSEDEDIFTYFKCYRANVRAKVHVLAAAQDTDKSAKSRDQKLAKKYLALMGEYISRQSNRIVRGKSSAAAGIEPRR